MRIQAPPNSGSTHYNYKQFLSMVLPATCVANYKFTWIDVGQYVMVEFGPTLTWDLEHNAMNLPDAEPLSGLNMPFPYVFVGDEAFLLTWYMMRPYARRDLTDEKIIYNYRLSRARRTVENAFGILCARWQILQKPVSMTSANLESTFQALVCLHNFLMMAEEMKNPVDRMYAPPGFLDREQDNRTVTEGRWRDTAAYFTALGRVGGNRSNHLAMGFREYLQHYFNSPVGYEQCPWQAQTALRGLDLAMGQ